MCTDKREKTLHKTSNLAYDCERSLRLPVTAGIKRIAGIRLFVCPAYLLRPRSLPFFSVHVAYGRG